MENSNNSGKVIGALLVGAAIGGVLGILFAPHKGSVTRRKIAGTTDDLTESLKEKFNTLLEETKKEFEAAKEKASEFVSDANGKFEAAKGSINEFIHDGKSKAANSKA